MTDTWTKALRETCADRCEPDPPCHTLGQNYMPCNECLIDEGFDVPEQIDAVAVIAPLL
jgi:hypothetical protein